MWQQREIYQKQPLPRQEAQQARHAGLTGVRQQPSLDAVHRRQGAGAVRKHTLPGQRKLMYPTRHVLHPPAFRPPAQQPCGVGLQGQLMRGDDLACSSTSITTPPTPEAGPASCHSPPRIARSSTLACRAGAVPHLVATLSCLVTRHA